MSYPSWQPWQGKAEGKDDLPPGQDRHAPRPWPGGEGVPQPWAGHSSPPMLASDADRERAVDVLRAGFGEGRLEKGEFDKRVERAYTARTVAELALLVADLPQGPVPRPAAPLTGVPGTFLPARPQTNGKAAGSLVCGALCLVTWGLTGIPAVVLGHVARSEIRRTGERGDGLALTGLVLGWLSTGGWALVLVLLSVVAVASG